MKIRLMNISDLDAVVELNRTHYSDIDWSNLSQEECFEIGLWWVEKKLLRWYHSTLQTTGGDIIIIETDGKIIGELDYAYGWDNIGEFMGYRYHIIWLYVDPDFRRRGIALKLILNLLKSTTDPIWVEPEDNISNHLYSQIGYQIHTHSNWELPIDQISDQILDHRIDFTEISYEQLYDNSRSYQLLIGRYYIPSYDLSQLQNSNDVENLMWNGTSAHIIHHYQLNTTQVMAYMTQYPRIFVSDTFDPADLKEILSSICLFLFEMGFDSIHLQIINSEPIINILRNLGFSLVLENDPVYCLYNNDVEEKLNNN